MSNCEDVLYAEALDGVRSGQLQNVVRYLRSERALQGELAQALAELLDENGNSDWRVRLSLRTKNRRTSTRHEEDGWRRIEVGAWTHVWIEGHARGLAQQVYPMMAKRFGCGLNYVRQALAHFRRVKGLIDGQQNDHGVLRDNGSGATFDIIAAKNCLWEAEEALKASQEELFKNSIYFSNSKT